MGIFDRIKYLQAKKPPKTLKVLTLGNVDKLVVLSSLMTAMRNGFERLVVALDIGRPGTISSGQWVRIGAVTKGQID